MLIKVYILLWVLVAAVAGGLFSFGYFNEIWLTVFGFLFSTLFFMSLTAILPWWVSQPFSAKR